ncbi:MAG TPA: HPr family phosphocarrier protein [Coprothermobacter proteolyticus]|jgi:phosphocarrier protein|uniref:Phosphocarrier protein n=1 Tax=Coprothermobacter proteolyticus (strain ATCC 35245 / DSM 5265 / OCM 4 / BT) TaxID=309798 RepID=B5YA47_COPPD|nr:HPr family phosphocarrier protein [Coprothermobacter proteolyticus]MBP8983316.1 HPr family phosphocarrier protein [Coprothermobacter sp.]ACI18056.1 PTS sugar transporter subunit IIA [Coprothermobacter proteolyticus DSM 5265]NLT83558.1 HPr family phosphocarrier protein [Coprothermobacter proteolyticus]HOA64474.1 HPr family phosphocarrier protein [Coprothermobacter proteolyticus]HOK24525.1 HPr family phosphocarrier protein [Coprothermobacter proteolyticus]
MEAQHVETEVILTNPTGLHARPASLLVQTAAKFKSNITLEKEGRSVSAKSIMGVLSLGADKGSRIKISVEGEDAEEALKALLDLIHDNFGEVES